MHEFGTSPFRFLKREYTPDANTQSQNLQPVRQSDIFHAASCGTLEVVGKSGVKVVYEVEDSTSVSLSSLLLKDLTDSTVVVNRPVASVFADGLRGCKVSVAYVAGAMLVTNCDNMSLEGHCAQLRLTDCKSVKTNVSVMSSVALSGCVGVSIGPPREYLASQRAAVISAGKTMESLDREAKWRNVYDFDDLRNNAGNWSIVD